MTNNVAVVHAHGYKADVYALAATRRLAVARVATCHPWTETTYSMRARFYTWLDKTLLSHFDHLVAVSEAVQEEALRARVSSQKISIIPNGIDLARFEEQHDRTELRRRYNLSAEHLLIGAIGRLVPEKAYHLLIETAARLRYDCPQAFFVIAGEGPLRVMLENEIARHGLSERFRLLGLCENIPEVLSMLDIFIISSVSEGMPMVVLEAMAAGKPIVATNVGEIAKVLPHDECGWIVEPSAEELARAVIKLWQNPLQAQRLAQNAHARACREYSSERMAQSYVEIYDRARITMVNRTASRRRKKLHTTSFNHHNEELTTTRAHVSSRAHAGGTQVGSSNTIRSSMR